MTVSGFAINLSNLIWTNGVEKAQVKRSVFMVQDLTGQKDPGVHRDRKRFWIYCGREAIEYCYVRYPAYLAVITESGEYRLEKAEKYLTERDGQLVFDVLQLPNEINGLQFQKVKEFQNTPWEREFNLPCAGISFHDAPDVPDLWTIEGWSTVTFVIGPSGTGKSHFIAENFKDCGYTSLDVLDYQQRADEDPDLKRDTSRERLFRANEWLKADIVRLVRQGMDVVVEQTFFRALRRIDCIEAIQRTAPKIPIEIYVMMPSEEQLRQNIMTRWGYTSTVLDWEIKRIKHEFGQIFEFPNPAEGFSRIYVVSDNSIILRMDAPDWTLPRRARGELREETRERTKAKEESERRKRLLKEAAHMQDRQECSSIDAAENEQ